MPSSLASGFISRLILRLQSEISLEMKPEARDEGIDCLVKSIEVARAQGACSFQLRAAAALQRLVAGTAGETRSRTLLEEALAAFPSETPWNELDTARALLENGPSQDKAS